MSQTFELHIAPGANLHAATLKATVEWLQGQGWVAVGYLTPSPGTLEMIRPFAFDAFAAAPQSEAVFEDRSQTSLTVQNNRGTSTVSMVSDASFFHRDASGQSLFRFLNTVPLPPDGIVVGGLQASLAWSRVAEVVTLDRDGLWSAKRLRDYGLLWIDQMPSRIFSELFRPNHRGYPRHLRTVGDSELIAFSPTPYDREAGGNDMDRMAKAAASRVRWRSERPAFHAA